MFIPTFAAWGDVWFGGNVLQNRLLCALDRIWELLSLATSKLACRVGGKMIRISIPYFYGLGAAVREVSGLQASMTLSDVWGRRCGAQTEPNNLLEPIGFSPLWKTLTVLVKS
jgi:hypothetical protein